MKYSKFEEVPVWQAGIDLTAKVFLMTEDRCFRFKGDIANQIQRAALSVPNNIAEGFERGTTQELIAFLYYAKGLRRRSAFDYSCARPAACVRPSEI